MTDEEQQAWDDDGIGQPPSHDPAGSITKFIIIAAATLLFAFAIAAFVRG